MNLNGVSRPNWMVEAAGMRADAAASRRDIKDLLGATGAEDKRAALRRAAQEFESVFLRQMIGAMRKTVGDGGLIRKSNGEKIFESMLDEEWAKTLAGKTGRGSLSEILYRQLSREMGLPAAENGGDASVGSSLAQLVPGGGMQPPRLRSGRAEEGTSHE